MEDNATNIQNNNNYNSQYYEESCSNEVMCLRIFYIFLLGNTLAWVNIPSPQQMKRAEIQPWMGVLKVRQGDTEFATTLTVIADGLALANANDISKLDEKILRTASALFFKYNVPWYCGVKSFKLHPEFNNQTLLNTLALVNLECKRKWTSVNFLQGNGLQKVYAIGLSDERYKFKQKLYNMKYVNSRKCLNFYTKEEINFDYLWPKHFVCYEAIDVKDQCVFDSGMALVTGYKGNWTLIGIGILGPGCVLPSRYINIKPYIPWLLSKIGSRRSDENENENENENKITIKTYNIVDDYYAYEEDDFYVTKLNHKTMVLQPKYKDVNEVPYGDCSKQDADLIYRDAGMIRTSKRPATGVYALSLYDILYEKITCVVVSVRCDRRSLAKFWFDRGFKTDDKSDLIKVVPHHQRGKPVPPKILFLTDRYLNYDKIPTANLLFKFEFTGQATINVDFFGKLKATTTTTEPTTTKIIPRTRPYYPYYFSKTTTEVPCTIDIKWELDRGWTYPSGGK